MNARYLPQVNASLAVALAMLYIAWWWTSGASLMALPLTALVAASLPLLLLAPALYLANRFGTTLAGLILPFHFAYAVMELIANPAVRAWVAAQTFITLLLLTGVMASLRQVRTVQDA